MSAALLREIDGPFELADVPDPAANGKVIVRVRAAGINFADVLVRRGRYPQMPELPAILGSEIAGELDDGTRVMAITSGAGGYAEKVAVDRAQVVPLPDHASFAEGAAFLLTFCAPAAMGSRHLLVYRLFELDGQREKHIAHGACSWNFAGAPDGETLHKSDPAIQGISRCRTIGLRCCVAVAGSG